MASVLVLIVAEDFLNISNEQNKQGFGLVRTVLFDSNNWKRIGFGEGQMTVLKNRAGCQKR